MGRFIRKEQTGEISKLYIWWGRRKFLNVLTGCVCRAFHGRGGNRRLKEKRGTPLTLLFRLKYNCLVKLNRTILVSMPIIMPPRVALLLWLTYAMHSSSRFLEHITFSCGGKNACSPYAQKSSWDLTFLALCMRDIQSHTRQLHIIKRVFIIAQRTSCS